MIFRITLFCLLISRSTLFAQAPNKVYAKELVRLLKQQKVENIEIYNSIKHIGTNDTIQTLSFICTDSLGEPAIMEDSMHFWFLQRKSLICVDRVSDKTKIYNGDFMQHSLHRLSRYYFPTFSDTYLSLFLQSNCLVSFFKLKEGFVYHTYLNQGGELEDTFFFFNKESELVKRVFCSVGVDRLQNGSNFEFVSNTYIHHKPNIDARRRLLDLKP